MRSYIIFAHLSYSYSLFIQIHYFIVLLLLLFIILLLFIAILLFIGYEGDFEIKKWKKY